MSEPFDDGVEQVEPGDPRYGLIWINRARMSGAPCFHGTRVPVQALFDCLEAGETIDDFLDGYPPITREHTVAVLELAQRRLIPEGRAA